MGKPVLAMYDVRGKQEFIFRTNKLREIVGGSWIIRDIYDDYLYESAKEAGGKIFNYRREDGDDPGFSRELFEKHINEDGYIGEVVYEGGGNFLLLFKSEKVFQDVTYQFTRRIKENIGSLHVLGTCIEIDNFDDYDEDRKRLYKEHRRNEGEESNIAPWSCLPIVQVDRKNSQPLVDYNYPEQTPREIKEKIKAKGVEGKLTKESTAKLLKYYNEIKRIEKDDCNKLTKIEREFYRNNEDLLDNLVTEKGVDSQLAVVYIDGNSMGAKVQKITEGKKKYEDCIQALRSFSEQTQKIYVEDGAESALRDLHGEKDEKVYRIVVSAGDEINFIVNAHDAFRCAESYLNYLEGHEGASACAGIAVFHSHAPYADVYQIAEEACESGKQKMKEAKLNCASFIDFHICQGAIGTSLDEIREEESEGIISRPWMLWNRSTESPSVDVTDYVKEVGTAKNFFNIFTRTNVKNLISAAKEGDVPLKMEINRMFGHLGEDYKKKHQDDWKTLVTRIDEDSKKWRGIIYDLALAYDLWFREEVQK